MLKHITNYYLSGSNESLKLKCIPNKTEGRVKIYGIRVESDFCRAIPIGYSDAHTQKDSYNKLIKNLELDTKSNNELIEYVLAQNFVLHNERTQKDHIENKIIENPCELDEIQMKFLDLRLLKSWTLNSIKSKLHINDNDIKIIRKIVKQQLENKVKTNIMLNAQKRRKLKEEHKEYIESLISENISQKCTAGGINQRLHNEFPDLEKVHNSTIIRCLKKDLRCSFKKLERKPTPSTTQNATRLLLEGAAIQRCLLELEAEILFIDEFKVNSRHHEFSGWTKIWEKGYVTTDKTEFSMSFICGVSNKRILGLMGVKETTTTEIIVIYLKNMLEELRSSNNNCNSQCVIIWDNATIHSGPEVRSFIKSSKLRVITIPAYQPVLNPTEKLINSIKMKLKKRHGEGRLMCLQTIKNSFDSVCKKQAQCFLEAAQQELQQVISRIK